MTDAATPADDTPLEQRVFDATRVSVASCGCPNLYIQLHDETGVVVAQGRLDVATGIAFGRLMLETASKLAGEPVENCAVH